MNAKPLTDLYSLNETFEANLDKIEPMPNDINGIKGSIHLLKFEQDNVFEGNSFEFAL